MTYLQKNKRNNRHSKINQIIFVIVLIVILFFAGSQVRGVAQFLNGPINIVKSVVYSPFETFFNYLKSKDNLVDQNSALTEENKRLKIELLSLDSLKQENQSIKNILKYSNPERTSVVSKVINSNSFSPYDTLVIDVGENSVTVGDEVFYANVPIGKIFEVYRSSSVVKLYSFNSEKISVKILKPESIFDNAPTADIDPVITNQLSAEAIGISSGGFKISVPKDVLLNINDIITKDDYVIGQIGSIEFDSSNTFQNVYFNFPFRTSDIEFVEIIKSI